MKTKKANNAPFVSCIVAAGGRGSRMGADINKIFLEYGEMPVLAHTLLALEHSPVISEIVIVAAEPDMLGCKDIAEAYGIKKLSAITVGGAERQDSVRNGLSAISSEADIVLIHDAARPLVTGKVLAEVVDAVCEVGAAATGVACKNTLKVADENGFIINTPDRSHMFEIQTPQGFTPDLIREAHRQAQADGIIGTDDCFLVERLNKPVQIVPGDYRNIKITTPEDLCLAEQYMILQAEEKENA
ncbi:MAG: 2-C-methyl-D-erythritol 4-phosphate cytidylyltransferase [Ruminococcaceae bacterium]|nr:2-C-methyl-D-erythritol 4-phosphate cytidylyltransferase [Oscillospiraceae bacterium]